MDVNNSAQDTTFNQGFTEAQNMGVVGVDLLVEWSSIETTAGSGTTHGTYVDPGAELATANAFYPANGASISINVPPIDMGKYVVPSDLAGKTLDDLTLVNRYLQMVDFVLSKLPAATFVNFQVGNEIDSSPQANTVAFWTSYFTFLSYVVPHIHTARPGVKVGVTATFNGAVGTGTGSSTTRAGFQQLATAMDEVGITYYPLNSSFIVEDVSVIATDFDTLTSLYSTPIYVEEAGFPTSATCNSSDAQQSCKPDPLSFVFASERLESRRRAKLRSDRADRTCGVS